MFAGSRIGDLGSLEASLPLVPSNPVQDLEREDGKRGYAAALWESRRVIEQGAEVRVGVIADTHDHLPKIVRAVECFNDLHVDITYHAGDYVAPFALARFEELASPLVGVFGNNDGEKQGLLTKAKALGISLQYPPFSSRLDELSTLLLHEPGNLDALIQTNEYDLIIHGHTHRQDQRRQGRTLVLNPGEACGWQYGTCSVMVLELPSTAVEVITL